jgi:hypothetical protein
VADGQVQVDRIRIRLAGDGVPLRALALHRAHGHLLRCGEYCRCGPCGCRARPRFEEPGALEQVARLAAKPGTTISSTRSPGRRCAHCDRGRAVPAEARRYPRRRPVDAGSFSGLERATAAGSEAATFHTTGRSRLLCARRAPWGWQRLPERGVLLSCVGRWRGSRKSSRGTSFRRRSLWVEHPPSSGRVVGRLPELRVGQLPKNGAVGEEEGGEP